MGGLFYSLGRLAGPHVRKARWTWYWATGTEADSIEAEYEVGLDLAAEVRKQFVPEPQKSELIGEIGAKLAGHIAKKQRRFSFEAIKDGPPNAFALPGGFIFITSSLMELCEFNSDEIAFILGHEMSHVIRGHAIERIITNSAISFGAKASGKSGIAAALINQIGTKFLQSAYSRKAETEADTLGILLADAAGFDPNASIRMLSKLAEFRKPSERFDMGAYFSSHPEFELRIKNARCVLERK